MNQKDDTKQPLSKDYWYAELRSLGIDPKRSNGLNDNSELANLVDNIKEIYFQDYRAAYDDKRFDYVI